MRQGSIRYDGGRPYDTTVVSAPFPNIRPKAYVLPQHPADRSHENTVVTTTIATMKRLVFLSLGLALAAVANASSPRPPPPLPPPLSARPPGQRPEEDDGPCPKIHIFGARETTAPPGFGSSETLVDLLRHAFPGAGGATAEAIVYPAAGGPHYGGSVTVGIAAVVKQTAVFAARCPRSVIIMHGYSQVSGWSPCPRRRDVRRARARGRRTGPGDGQMGRC